MLTTSEATAMVPAKILVADDDPVFRHQMESLLQKWGYHVDIARGGNEAWEQLQQPGGAGILLLDWMMPDVDGVDLCQRIKAEFHLRSTYIILVTANPLADDLVCALDAGADDFIAKPVNTVELLARIRVGVRITEFQRMLQSLALQDPLTGLGNRRAFAADIERAINAAVRHNIAVRS